MPFLSGAQSRWAFTPAGKKALGGTEKVKEWADATDYSKLPERVDDHAPKSKPLLGGAIRGNHGGA